MSRNTSLDINAAAAIGALVGEIEAYLWRLKGPGIADVRAGISRWKNGPMQSVTSRKIAVCDLLDSALHQVRTGGRARLANAIQGAMPYLHWTVYDLYPRALIGAEFADGHGFASLIGEGSLIEAEDFDLGLFLIGPSILYRDHHHAAPELYAPLTGPHGWRFDPRDPFTSKEAHEPVWNEPWQPHATMTGGVAFLCIYCWTRDVNEPAKVITSQGSADVETLP